MTEEATKKSDALHDKGERIEDYEFLSSIDRSKSAELQWRFARAARFRGIQYDLVMNLLLFISIK